MLATDRRNEILKTLSIEGSVKVSKLTREFDVSVETIRRDLEILEKKELLKRVHGGAILKGNKPGKLNYSKRKDEFINEKIEIAKKAVTHIEEGSLIVLNNSTTNLEIAKEIKHHFEDLTIITNSLMIVNELADKENFTLILLGGVLNSKEYSFDGQFVEGMLSNFIAHKAFLSVGGVSLLRGVTDYLMSEIHIQKQFMEIAQEVIILVTSNNIDNESLVKIADIEDINLIITDSNLNPDILQKYTEYGVEIQ